MTIAIALLLLILVTLVFGADFTIVLVASLLKLALWAAMLSSAAVVIAIAA